ncbi:hypothetical protein BgiMline_013009, partial [Biomphalaria glabrata]
SAPPASSLLRNCGEVRLGHATISFDHAIDEVRQATDRFGHGIRSSERSLCLVLVNM